MSMADDDDDGSAIPDLDALIAKLDRLVDKSRQIKAVDLAAELESVADSLRIIRR